MQHFYRLIIGWLILLFLGSTFKAQSQGETNIWYFGYNAGLDFNLASPLALSDGLVNAQGGSATQSDENGELLFYTDGMKIWNKNHSIMPNSWGLLGHASSTQNSLILLKPGSTNLYYVFTNGANFDNNGLSYSEVDMSLNGGLGDVTSVKNVSLLTPTTEKLTAVRHGNTTDFWVLTVERNTNNYYAWPVTATGVGSPVVTSIGTPHSGANPNSDVSIGQAKFSPDGTKLAIATSANGNTFELFDFNKFTGGLSNPITISGSTYASPYGVEFSPDGTLLYCSVSNTNNKVYQFNLQAGSASAIINSATLVAQSASTNVGALQLGSDSKIYLARYNAFYLGVFNNPNVPGAGSNYEDDGVNLGTYRSRVGLPNFITSFFNNPRFIYENLCFGDSTFFYISDLNGVISVNWNFGDPGSGSLNTSTSTEAFHIFSDYGTFSVQLVRNFGNTSDTVTQTITINPVPAIDLGPYDVKICEGSDTLFNAGSGFATYEWMNGSSVPTMVANLEGVYAVTVTDDFGCVNSDSVEVSYLIPPGVELGADQEICFGESISLSAWAEQGEYAWSTGSSAESITASETGIYSITVSNRCGEATDSMELYVYPEIDIELGEDIEICPGDTAVLAINQGDYSFNWSTGATTTTIESDTAGIFYLTAFHQGTNCPEVTDSIQVLLLDVPVVSAGNDTLVCEGETILLNATGEYISNYLWNTGATTAGISTSTAGLYYVVASNICAEASDTVEIAIQPAPQVEVTNDTTLYDDETIELFATYFADYQYSWLSNPYLSSTNIHNPTLSATESTLLTLTVSDSLGCKSTYTIDINVLVRPLPDLIIYNVFTPNQDGVNDYFVVENIERYENSFLQVFNRNGNKVFEARNYQNDWDGRYQNEPLPAHTYFFILDPGVEEKEVIKSQVTILY